MEKYAADTKIEAKSELSGRFDSSLKELVSLTQIYFWNGRSKEALHILNQLLPITGIRDVQHLRLPILLQLGKIQANEYVYTNGDPEPMFSVLNEARRLAEQSKDRKSLADALSSLGTAHYFAELNASPTIESTSGQYKKALNYHEQALQLRVELQDNRGISESYFQIGTVHERWQKKEMALNYYAQAARIAEEHHFPLEQSEPARHFAFHAFQSGDLDEALKFAQHALSLRETAGFKPHLPLDHLLLSDIYLKRGQIETARQHAETATRLGEEMGYLRAVSSSCLTLGDIELTQQRVDAARTYYERALRLGHELKLPLAVHRAEERLKQLSNRT
ncbi:tetratricopeptide (TPR) repeat protein [Paenibacillus rhizosphaerae]|uniref:Tetratricopeptide (TPR) repeat protein n=1 Tax=Paenibacillus rhizosphaerae TaxID=297318 RepID=A0A839TRJ7_9BACL|nr:tetratricopeptide repeat protein [Paenibacillus rhizosphaerae]MBB3128028.1 tetratricopeptide (TPR) repeat protein [Paenibacillus rhizosphaerae]